MKKIFSLFAAVLMAGSMMAEPTLIKFDHVQPATEVAGSTYGSNGFTLVIPTESDKASVDANNCTFGVSAEETVSFTHRLKTGGASSKAGRKFTLNIPEEGPLAIYARTSSSSATDRNFVIANGSDTIVNHICLDTDTVEGASSKIFLPFIVENVPAGTYEVTYPVNGINFYGFQMGVEEEDTPVTLGTFFISSAEINEGKVGDIALGTNGYGSQAVATPATWYTCAKGDYTFKGAKVCVATIANGGGIQMQGNASDATKMGFFGNATAFNNIHSVKVVLRTASTATYAPVFNLYTDSLGTTNAIASADTVQTTEGSFKKFVYTYTYAEPGKFFNIKDDLAGALYIDTIYVIYEKGDEPVISVADPVFSVAAGSYYEAQTVELSCETEGADIHYTLDGTEPTATSTLYTTALTISETTTVKAIAIKGADQSEVVEKTYTIAPVYNSFDELVNQAGAPANQKVVVNFENVVIDSLYVTSKGKVNGVYLTAAGRMVEIYCYDVPTEWEVGGTISGVVKGEWKEWNGTWEVCPTSWDGITYTASAPTINYWLVGTAAENGWDQTNAMPMVGDQIVRHLNAGTYEFKVLTAEASWTGALGYANLNAEASSANVFGDDNVAFELENESDVTIKVVEGQIVLLGTFKEQVVADYYIKFAGNNWTWVPMTQAPSGYYMYEGVWGGVGANVNTSMSDNGASWFPEADIMFLDESMEELPVPAVGTEGIYVYMQYAEPVLAFIYEGTPAGWDGTVTLSKTTINSIADLEGITLTFNGATTVEFLGADADIIALQNKNGSELHAAWHPEYGGSYTINGNVVTLTGWFDNTEEAPLPEQNATLYVEDYGAFKIDGAAEFFETAEIAFETAGPTTYTVTYTVTGAVAEEAAAQAGYYNLEGDGAAFVAGANTVPENMIAYVYAQMIDGYTVEVKVNDAAVTLTDGYWEAAITADMTIEVTFTEPQGEGGNTTVSKTMLEVVNENSYTVSAGQDVTCYTSFQLDEVVTISTTGEPNCGSFWTNTLGTDWRLYQAKSGNVTITLAEGYELVSITIDYYNSNDGELTGLPYNTKDTNVSGSTKTYTVGNAGTKTNGQVRILSITVEYKISGPTTAIENVEAEKAVKVIENGQVIIIREGVRYNVAGQKL